MVIVEISFVYQGVQYQISPSYSIDTISDLPYETDIVKHHVKQELKKRRISPNKQGFYYVTNVEVREEKNGMSNKLPCSKTFTIKT